MRATIVLVAWTLLTVMILGVGRAAVPVAVPVQVEIPKSDFKSWTLLLITDPSSFANENLKQLSDLHALFVKFGEAIGPKNAAVWFLKKPTSSLSELDIARNVEFANHLGLKPSGGPYIIVTTNYPGAAMMGNDDSFPTKKKDMVVLELKGMKPAEISKLLNKLVDAVTTQNLSKIEVASDTFWQRMFSIVAAAILGAASSVNVTVEGGPISVELKIPSERG
jgi:hypothetical protein